MGNSTSAGNWIDGNGIPVGITLSFNATFTVSTPTPGSYLTLNTTLGNGIGIAQSTGAAGNNNIGEILNISAISLSSINFAGNLAESGFSFIPGTVANTKWNRFRSNNFPEASAGMTVSVGTDTWGFGTSTGNQGSNLIINNNYNETVGFSTGGPLELTTQAGTGWNLKGVAFQYEVSYDISVIPEPTTSVLALLGGFALLTMRRRAA